MGTVIKQKDRRELMTRAGVELLEQDGPNAMTARKITAKIGMSSIAVYTEFGSMEKLVASVVDYGFLQLLQIFQQTPNTNNILLNIWNVTCNVREFALAHRHLYAVMFAAESIGGYQRSGEELEQGIETLKFLHNLCSQAVKEKVFTQQTAHHATQFIWATMHGRLMLELAGYLSKDKDPMNSYRIIITTCFVGLGANSGLVTNTIPINSLNLKNANILNEIKNLDTINN
ncbi:TetR/AcrR family transcriptional regulator [Acinetobacter oleivorans]|uniref:TetR/AcrR family transcriptional regulator n=1 Tax=Acinetobacter oleivorans TaxID=1148157 RepID=UPI0019025A0D|nr:TetR/AcrR family transcriptional regulator [Acinetobacter oleivorans]MBJ8496237.1 TetR/AcrR family transcriptional regulator [Acinetobacter oleivorans]